MRKLLKLSALCSVLLGLVACSDTKEKEVTVEKVDQAEAKVKASLAPIEKHLIRAFWMASDETLRENSPLNGHGQKVDAFIAEHRIALHEFKAIEGGVYEATFRVTIPEVKNAFYEFVFRGYVNGWESFDARTKMMNGKELFEKNYFAGKFLAGKDLKPYLDKHLRACIVESATQPKPE